MFDNTHRINHHWDTIFTYQIGRKSIGGTRETDSNILLMGTQIYKNVVEENLAKPTENTYIFTYWFSNCNFRNLSKNTSPETLKYTRYAQGHSSKHYWLIAKKLDRM